MPEPLSTLPAPLLAKLQELCERDEQITGALEDPVISADHKAVRDLSIRKAAIEPIVRGYRLLLALDAEIMELLDALGSGDPELAELAEGEIPRIQRRAGELIADIKTRLVTADDRAVGSVMIEIRAGTGGDEAGLWASDLMGIYEKYATRRGWGFEVLDITTDSATGGVRHAVIGISGEGVWSELAFEAGVHSVKRVPATESQGRIHTSTATVAVLPEPEEVQVEIDWANDVTEHITTAQGPGGQNVNKVATAVHLVHKPTGVEVRMQESKSQKQNRDKARRLLLARVYEIQRAQKEAARDEARRSQIGGAGRSEKIRVYRYQDGIVSDERLDDKLQLRLILEGDLAGMFEKLLEQEISRRLESL